LGRIGRGCIVYHYTDDGIRPAPGRGWRRRLPRRRLPWRRLPRRPGLPRRRRLGLGLAGSRRAVCRRGARLLSLLRGLPLRLRLPVRRLRLRLPLRRLRVPRLWWLWRLLWLRRVLVLSEVSGTLSWS